MVFFIDAGAPLLHGTLLSAQTRRKSASRRVALTPSPSPVASPRLSGRTSQVCTCSSNKYTIWNILDEPQPFGIKPCHCSDYYLSIWHCIFYETMMVFLQDFKVQKLTIIGRIN